MYKIILVLFAYSRELKFTFIQSKQLILFTNSNKANHTNVIYIDERPNRQTLKSNPECRTILVILKWPLNSAFNRIAPFEFRAFDWLLYLLFIYWANERVSERVWRCGVIVCVIFKWNVLHVQGFCVTHTHSHVLFIQSTMPHTSIDGRIDWLAGWLAVWLTDWLIGLIVYWTHTHVLCSP